MTSRTPFGLGDLLRAVIPRLGLHRRSRAPSSSAWRLAALACLAVLAWLVAPAGAWALPQKICPRIEMDLEDAGNGETYWNSSTVWAEADAAGMRVRVRTYKVTSTGGCDWNTVVADTLGYLDATGCSPAIETGSSTKGCYAVELRSYGDPDLSVGPTGACSTTEPGCNLFVWGPLGLEASTAYVTGPLYPDGDSHYPHVGAPESVQNYVTLAYAYRKWGRPIGAQPGQGDVFTDDKVKVNMYLTGDAHTCGCSGDSTVARTCLVPQVSGSISHHANICIPDIASFRGPDKKFVVTHQWGHVALYLPGALAGTPLGLVRDCSYPAVGGANQTHDLESREWSGCALVEGFAHFVAADTFNEHTTAADGVFTHWEPCGDQAGGVGDRRVKLEATGFDPKCSERYLDTKLAGSTTTAGQGNELDWLRFFWDYHTDTDSRENGGGLRLSHASLLKELQVAGRTVSSHDNAFDVYRGAVVQAGGCEQASSRMMPLAQANGVAKCSGANCDLNDFTASGLGAPLPCDPVPARFVGRADPTTWLVHSATGLRYRRTTAAERIANEWPGGTFLFDATSLLSAATTGASSVTMRLPFDDGDVRAATLSKFQSTNDVEFIERGALINGNASVSLTRPMVHAYTLGSFTGVDLTGLSDGKLATMVAGDSGFGLLFHGISDKEGVSIAAPGTGWTVSPLANAPSTGAQLGLVKRRSFGPHGEGLIGQCENAPASAACKWACTGSAAGCQGAHRVRLRPDATRCSNGSDDDGDGAADAGDLVCAHHPSPSLPSSWTGPEYEYLRIASWGCEIVPHTHDTEEGSNFALMGTGTWCTQARKQGSWAAVLFKEGQKAAETLNSAKSPTTSATSRFAAAGCWMFPSDADAVACETDGTVCVTRDADEYPYRRVRGSGLSHLLNVWDDVHHGTRYGLSTPLQLAVAVSGMTGPHLTDDSGGPFHPSPSVCGVTRGDCQYIEQIGAAVVAAGYTPDPMKPWEKGDVTRRDGCPLMGWVIAHEIGHQYGLDHDTSRYEYQEGYYQFSFMNEGADNGTASVLEPCNVVALDGALRGWRTPRPSGFRFSGTPTESLAFCKLRTKSQENVRCDPKRHDGAPGMLE